MIRYATEEVVILPAYGRQYSNANEALEDWKNGKDFQINNGPYCSIRDVQAMKEDGIQAVLFGRHNGTFITRINLLD